MQLNFSAAVSDWVRKSQARTKAVLQQSSQALFEQAQTPGPSVANPAGGAGGKLPIETGFLRSSFAVSFDGMPSGPSRGDPKTAYAYDEAQVTLKLTGVEVGKTIYAGWCADYAVFAEERYGFCRSAAANWQTIVSGTIEKAKALYP